MTQMQHIIARGTPGFSGADLANLVNEAALFAARSNKRKVGQHEFEKAKDKIMMGAERRSMVMNDEEKKLTAYHEAGHAIVGILVERNMILFIKSRLFLVDVLWVSRCFYQSKIVIAIPNNVWNRKLLDYLAVVLPKNLIFGEKNITTGASNDIEKATEIARNMVTKWGLSENLGPLTYGEEEGEVFLGREMSRHKNVSDTTAHAIDSEIRIIIERNYQLAEKILNANIDKLHLMAEALIKFETIGEQQIQDIMAGRDARPPADWIESDFTTPTQPSAPNENESDSSQPTTEVRADSNPEAASS